MTDAVIEYRDEDTGTVFRWHGGAYVDVGYIRHYEDSDPEFKAEDVINVWDDERDISVFEREAVGRRPFRHILEMFESACAEYLARVSEDDDGH
jgi:hypothetical protein